jgi:hypothetical protein
MILFPFLILPCCLETATTIEKEKVVWNDYNYSEQIFSQRILNIPDMSELFDIKNNKLTTVVLESGIENSNASSEIFQDVFLRNYDIHIPLLINKSFHFKGKVKSISRFKPSIHI